ncbi:unnamed protein product, partial [Iphiclides podalirius]
MGRIDVPESMSTVYVGMWVVPHLSHRYAVKRSSKLFGSVVKIPVISTIPLRLRVWSFGTRLLVQRATVSDWLGLPPELSISDLLVTESLLNGADCGVTPRLTREAVLFSLKG